MPRNIELSMLINNTQVTVESDLFIEAYQEGYLRFKKDFEGQPLSDRRIYHFLAQNVYFLGHQDVENAGYITGWYAALFERVGEPRMEVTVTEDLVEETITQ